MLVGRTVESGRLDALLAGAASGRGGALVVRGEPGVGKTALLENAVTRADALVLRTVGVESESPLAFAALHRLLRPVLDSADRLSPAQAEALLVALGVRDGRSPDRFMVFVATLTLLGEVAERGRPVVVVADDAHWLDEASGEALLFVARRLESDPVAVVFGARDGDVRRFEAPGLDEMVLHGLPADDAGALLAQQTGLDVSDEVRDLLQQHTGGNPLALVELPGVLSGLQLTGADRLPSLLPLTGGVERSFLDRSRRLDASTQRLLLVAASDDSGQVALVQRAAALLAAGDEALAEAERSGLVRVVGGELSFRHPLVRSAVYGAATVSERREVHRALAAAMDGAGEDDRRAWHLALATVGVDAAVALELEAVAARAEHRGGHAAASAAFEQAALLSPTAEDKARRLLGAARAAWTAGHPARARALADDARARTSDQLLAADVDRLRARVEWNTGSASVGHRIVMTAARSVEPFDPVRALEMAMLGTTLATYGAGSGTADRDLDAFVPALPADAGPRLQCLASLVAGEQHVLADRLGEAATCFRRAFALAATADEDVDVLANTALAAFHLGEWEVTSRALTRMLDTARASGDVSRMVFALSRLPMADIPAGHWDAAGAANDEALALAQATGQPALRALPLAWRALLTALRGDTGGPDSLTEVEALTAAGTVGVGAVAVGDLARWARGVTAANEDDHPGAFRHLARLRLPSMRRAASVDLLEAAIHGGQHDAAGRWATELETFADDTGSTWAAAAAAHGRALLADGPLAEELFARALRLHEEDPRPFAQARTQLAYGGVLRRSGRRLDARAHLRAALETFDELGTAPWADRAAEALRASGERSRKRDPSTARDLTPQEQQVVRLVRQGLSNRDVAGRLFVSPRTVEYHLSHAYEKLGVRSRSELVGLALAPA